MLLKFLLFTLSVGCFTVSTSLSMPTAGTQSDYTRDFADEDFANDFAQEFAQELDEDFAEDAGVAADEVGGLLDLFPIKPIMRTAKSMMKTFLDF